MPKIGQTQALSWQKHKQNWSECTFCNLCEKRDRVVLAKGTVPCDILFIGEAPGPSENVIGQPFVGPAGKLLDQIIAEAIDLDSWRIAFTNLIACIPLDDANKKFAEPTKESIAACSPRLNEFVRLCKPRMIVRVGKLTEKHVPGWTQFGLSENHGPMTGIIHPAAILRADVSQQGLLYQAAVATLADAVSEGLVPF